jgi:hypothetical protein
MGMPKNKTKRKLQVVLQRELTRKLKRLLAPGLGVVPKKKKLTLAREMGLAQSLGLLLILERLLMLRVELRLELRLVLRMLVLLMLIRLTELIKVMGLGLVLWMVLYLVVGQPQWVSLVMMLVIILWMVLYLVSELIMWMVPGLNQPSSTSKLSQLYSFFPEEQRNDVTTKIRRLRKAKKSQWFIRIKAIQYWLELLAADIQIRWDNLWLPRNKNINK